MTILTRKQSLERISLHFFSKYQNFKITGLHQPPDLQTLKAYPSPKEVVRVVVVVVVVFLAKMRGKDEVKGRWSNFTPWLRVL